MNYLVIGGTGTLGTKIIERLLAKEDTNRVACFSRCELKQANQRKQFTDARLKFFLGDIRDPGSLQNVFDQSKFDIVFHVAALKHIDILEDNPLESVATNILGTLNVARACVYNCVKHLVFSSTDKAVEPINVYGMCKSISEKILMGMQKHDNNVNFSVYRWGNIFFSRGSALAYFKETLLRERKAYVTSTEMTRYWLEIDEAVDFMLNTFERHSFEAKIPNLKAAAITDVIDAIATHLNVGGYSLEIIGLRKGEKLHESIKEGEPSSALWKDRFTKEELVEKVARYL